MKKCTFTIDETMATEAILTTKKDKPLTKSATIDRLRLQQEDPPHDALRPQGLPRPQRPRRRHAPDAQPHIRRRDLARRFSTKES